MREDDPLDRVLREWQAPEPPPAAVSRMDARVLAAFRQTARPALWRRFLQARISVPVPVLAMLLVIVAALVIQFQWGRTPPPQIEGYVTRIEATGFQPLRDGAARVVRRAEVRRAEVRQ
jgi:hypothetical protein